MKKVKLTVTILELDVPQTIMIEGETKMVDLENAVRSAIPIQTVLASADHATILKITYNPKGN